MTLEELYAVNPDFFNKNWYGEPMDGYTCVSVGSGWYSLVALAAENAEEGVYAQDIKEKFGELRIYCHGIINYLTMNYEDYLTELAGKSLTICENCGSTKDVTTSKGGGYWLKTYCQECHKGR